MTLRREHSTLRSVNPATGKVLAEYPVLQTHDVFLRLRKSAEAYGEWSDLKISDRAKRMKRLANILRKEAACHATLITKEMGKPIVQAKAEIEKCALACDYFADHAKHFLSRESIATDASRSYIDYEPLGAILAIMPWNFPYWQVFRFAAPTLMAGNVAVLKHASNVPGCSLAIEKLFLDAGFPVGTFQSMLVRASMVSDILKHPMIKAVSLTGSERAGRMVASEAASLLKKSVLELGGSDPFIVLGDANIEQTVDGAVLGRTQNAGQSCIAAKRFIVTRRAAKKFIPLFVAKLQALRMGDPLDEGTQIGPLAREDLVSDLDAIVAASVERGAEVLCGGKRVKGKGCFYEPTVLAEAKPGMEVFDEETFGPVAAISVVRNADEAIALANKSRFGLGASIWTGNVAEALKLTPRIEAGSVFINGIVKSDPRLPFGGIKASGYGRELSCVGIREFVNIKSIWAA